MPYHIHYRGPFFNHKTRCLGTQHIPKHQLHLSELVNPSDINYRLNELVYMLDINREEPKCLQYIIKFFVEIKRSY